MSSVIVISSSPARTFARSPTRVDFSSPPRPSQTSSDSTKGDLKDIYRPTRPRRDRCSPRFTTAKQILAPRSSAENVPLGVASPPKFKLTPPRASTSSLPKPRYLTDSATALPVQLAKDATSTPGSEWDIPLEHTVVKILPSDARRKKKTDSAAALNLQKAVARRKDWTPEKPHAAVEPESAGDAKAEGFRVDLLKSFGHSQISTGVQRIANSKDGALTKRRKVSLTDIREATASSKQATTTKPTPKLATVRSKSPVKKSKTITARTTGAYADDADEAANPMMQYLLSTQANMDAERDPENFEIKVRKQAAKPKKGHRKSRLRSPETALKTLESQDILFASASQLVRDESPTLLRDTAEAIKRSEEHHFSSSLRSQQTAVFSVESATPQRAASSRHRGRLSLWSAADRDENDALLHMDESLDTLITKDAFAGTDALYETSAAITKPDQPDDSMTLLAVLKPEETTTYDIDDVTTPPLRPGNVPPSFQQTRTYSTSSRSSSRNRGKSSDSPKEQSPIPKSKQTSATRVVSSPTRKKKIPNKPNYTTWTDEELKDAVKAHGFKRLRARKTMIDKLDEQWAEQHGVDPAVVKAATKRASQTAKEVQSADFLGSVHGLATRPVPKPKKARKKRLDPDVGKLDNGSGSRALEDDIVDISDIENLNLTAMDRVAAIKITPDEPNGKIEIQEDEEEYEDILDLPPSTAPIRGTGVKATAAKRKPKAGKHKSDRPLTPPPTMPAPSQTQLSSPAFEELRKPSPAKRKKRRSRSTSPVIPATPEHMPSSPTINSSAVIDDVPLKSRVREAISKQPSDDATRNHYTDPTWHEKMLLYDPIVIEELTAWLNSEGFNAIGEDREISLDEVKDWCHEHGICCLWKGGWRGNKKKVKDVIEED